MLCPRSGQALEGTTSLIEAVQAIFAKTRLNNIGVPYQVPGNDQAPDCHLSKYPPQPSQILRPEQQVLYLTCMSCIGLETVSGIMTLDVLVCLSIYQNFHSLIHHCLAARYLSLS